MNDTLIVAIIALIGSLASILVPLLKKPHEVNKLDAETAKAYAEAAKLSAERAEKAENGFNQYRIENEAEKETIRRELENYKLEILEERAKLREEIDQIRQENGDLKDWAERLVHQVQSLGGIPVPLKPTKSKK